MNKEQKKEYKFELRLADGKTRSFNSGFDMYQWAINSKTGWKFELKDKAESK